MRFLPSVVLSALLGLGGILAAQEKLPDGLYAEFTTPHGAFTAELYPAKVPLTVTNFVGLAEGTLGPKADQPYFTGLKWYRVVPGFVIQSGNAKFPDEAYPGYDFADEFVPGLRHGGAGILSMANAGPDTNGGEFFITLGDCSRLNYLHSVFGRVVRGLDVLPQIKPDDAFRLKILRVGAAAQAFQADEVTFKALAGKSRKYSGALEPGPTAHFADPDQLLPVDPPRAKAFNFKLANYERFTGVKIVARLSAHLPPATEDEVAGVYMRKLAEKLGVARTGVLVAFFAPDDWRVWLGDDLTSAFLGRPATAADLGEGGPLHEAKEALITTALKRGDDTFAAQQQAAPPDRQPPPAQHLKLQVDALLDALLLRFEPKP